MRLGIFMAATATLGLVFESQAPKAIGVMRQRNDVQAAATLAAIASAQAVHRERTGRYGTLEDLAWEGLIEGVDRARGTLTRDGFEFEAAPSLQVHGERGWQAVANPVVRGLTSEFSFLAHQDTGPRVGRATHELKPGGPLPWVEYGTIEELASRPSLIDGVLSGGVKQGYVFTTDDRYFATNTAGVIFYNVPLTTMSTGEPPSTAIPVWK